MWRPITKASLFSRAIIENENDVQKRERATNHAVSTKQITASKGLVVIA